MSLQSSIHNWEEEMEHKGLAPETGLGEEMFLFASTLMPVVNVDLLVRNSKGEFLLSWRDDPRCGTGWHIPGGCIRFRESVSERAQKTALREFGHPVALASDVLHVFEIFASDNRPITNQNERAHFMTLVITGNMPDDFCIEKQSASPGEAGYLQWFAELPDNLLSVQDCYKEHWHTIQDKLKGIISNGNLEK